MDYVGSLALILIVTAVAGHLSVPNGPTRGDWPIVKWNYTWSSRIRLGLSNKFYQRLRGAWRDYFNVHGRLRERFKIAEEVLASGLLVAVLGVILPVAVIDWCSQLFHLNATESLFLGVTFAATSVSISVAVLKELGALDGKEGTTILGAAVVDDVLAVLILSLMISLFGSEVSGGGMYASTNLGLSLAIQLAFFVAGLWSSGWCHI